MKNYHIALFLLIFAIFFAVNFSNDNTLNSRENSTSPYVVVLGVAQDGGAPHAGCLKECCEERWDNSEKHLKVSSIAIVDPKTNETWIIDATPDFASQLNSVSNNELKGVFLTHAHIGHYTGLIHLGREVMGAKEIPVYAMPKMKTFLESLTDSQFQEISQFFDTQPKLQHEISLHCKNKVKKKECGHKEKQTLEGLQSFFG